MKKLKKYAHRSQEKNADVVTRLTEVFNNSEIIKANATEAYELERFSVQNRKFFKINMKSIYVGEIVSPFMEMIGAAGLAAGAVALKKSSETFLPNLAEI